MTSYLNDVHQFALNKVKKENITRKQLAGERIYEVFMLQSIDVLTQALKELKDKDIIDQVKHLSCSFIAGELLKSHPAYKGMQELEEVEPVASKLEIVVPAEVDAEVAEEVPPAAPKVVEKEAPKVTDKTAPNKTAPKKSAPAEVPAAPKKAAPAAPKKAPRPVESKLDVNEYPTLEASREPAKKLSWADDVDQAEYMSLAEQAERAALIEKLSWSGRIKAASLKLAEIELLVAEEMSAADAKEVPETPVKAKPVDPVVPDAPKKEKSITTPHLGTPKQLDLEEVAELRHIDIDEPGWQPARKSKIAKVTAPISGKTSVISEEYCAKHLKTSNQKPDRAGTVTSAGWYFAKMAGKMPVVPDKFDWYARKLDEKNCPIGWIVLDRDSEGTPTTWQINRSSQFIHRLKKTAEGKPYLAHFEMCYVKDAAGNTTTHTYPVSVDYLLWTLCPGQLQHKLGDCPKA